MAKEVLKKFRVVDVTCPAAPHVEQQEFNTLRAARMLAKTLSEQHSGVFMVEGNHMVFWERKGMLYFKTALGSGSEPIQLDVRRDRQIEKLMIAYVCSTQEWLR